MIIKRQDEMEWGMINQKENLLKFHNKRQYQQSLATINIVEILTESLLRLYEFYAAPGILLLLCMRDSRARRFYYKELFPAFICRTKQKLYILSVFQHTMQVTRNQHEKSSHFRLKGCQQFSLTLSTQFPCQLLVKIFFYRKIKSDISLLW